MAQSPPPLKHPVAISPTPASSQTGLVTSPSNFIPRKEFLKDHRTASSFSLLALSSSNLVRLYSFSDALINLLRRLFNQKDLIAAEREHAPKQFHEFALEGKPWSSSKSISSEKLIVDILAIVLHSGYTFLSTIDYGREADDKLAMAFSRPVLHSNSNGPFGYAPINSSVVSLNAPPRTPFAISFASSTLLRVVGPPLRSTPAILTAVRGAWPRGVVYDKKVGDATFEFKLKGYKCEWISPIHVSHRTHVDCCLGFQEDTFPMDSLNHILGLLTSLDGHGFTLLTSLSFNKPSRMKDLWIFTGISDEHSPPPTPTTLTHEPKRDPFAYSIIPGPSPLSARAEKHSSPGIISSTSPPNGHVRSASEQLPSSSASLKAIGLPFGTAPTAPVPKPSPKSKLPKAFLSSKLNRSSSSGTRLSRTGTPTMEHGSRPSPAQMVRSLSNPSVGSVDMTGIGRRSMSNSPRTPDVFYMTDGRGKAVPGQEYNPFNESLKPNAQPPHAAFIKVTTPKSDRRASLDSKNTYERPSLRPKIRRSSTIPVTLDSQESNPSTSRIEQPSTVAAQVSAGPEHVLTRGNELPHAKRKGRELPAPLRLSELRRTPTPPLLTPGTFRDSAFSWQTSKTQEVPIIWIGHEPDPSKNNDRSVILAGNISSESHRNVRSVLHTSANDHPEVDRTNSGPLPPGGWVSLSTPREEKSDVSQQSYKLIPPTIREYPSREEDQRQNRRMSKSTTKHFVQASGGDVGKDALYRSTERGAERRAEEVTMGTMGHTARTSGSTTVSSVQPPDSIVVPKPKPVKRESAMSGWVMVNVEGAPGSTSSSNSPSRTGKSPSQSPPGSRPNVRHRRSNSDSGLLRPQINNSPVGNALAPATMSSAVKSIAMLDAIDANKEEREKSYTSSGLKRIFHRARGSESDSGGKNSTLRRKTTPDSVGSKGKELGRVQSEEKHSLKDRLKTRASPPAVKTGTTRQSID
ncbi:hypothetical protein BDY19DRAFT_36573 [Irpex rosettiformis]|uniref:Uncharacterized protein n=1 Tax=Irpex rosettiformis TaxID=378272 RepID=A0ACB8UKP9_9APHY|nr:hypothetical protein BDY19DRAFT_36573 [Irpex rosettiformis]